MATLTNTKIKDTYDGLLKTNDNGVLGGTSKEITDGLGNGSGLYIGTNGRFGIGMGSPSAPVDIVSDSNANGILLRGRSSDSIGTLNFSDNAGNVSSQIQDRNGSFNITIIDASPILLNTSSTERMRIDSSGNVGINNSNPNISGFSNAITLGGADSGFEIANSGVITAMLSGNSQGASVTGVGSSGIRFRTSASGATTERMRIDSSGNVGIGTSNLTSIASGYQGITINGSGGGLNRGGFVSFKQVDTEIGRVVVAQNEMAMYTTGAYPLVFSTDGSERMRIDSSGNVGIGTSSPIRKLEVASDGANWISGTFSGTGSTDKVVIGNLTTPTIGGHNSALNSWSDFTIAAENILFSPFGTERMRIDSSGNVGIGTSSPDTPLDVRGLIQTKGADSLLRIGELNATSTFIQSISADTTTSRDLVFFGTAERMRITSGGTIQIGASAGYTTINQGAFFTKGGGDMYTANLLAGAGVTPMFKLQRNDVEKYNIGLGNNDNLAFINASGVATVSITSGGDVHIAPLGQTDGALVVGRNGNNNSILSVTDANNTSEAYFRGYSTAVSNTNVVIYSNGNIVNTNNSYGAISDAKLKENVVDSSPKLEDLMQVQVRNFNYIGSDKKQLGVVAQELEEVFPSMISESPDTEEQEVPQLDENGQEVLDENGDVVMTTEKVDLGTTTKSVKYSVFVPMLIKAMQEQQEIINDLKTRIETLENK